MTRRAALCIVTLTAMCSGCFQNAAEKRGEYHKAYDIYCRNLKQDPNNAYAAAGIKRTASRAAAYWQQRSYAAAEVGNWDETVACHKTVLKIKPDEHSSIISLRQITLRRVGDRVLPTSAPAPVRTVAKPAVPRKVAKIDPYRQRPVLNYIGKSSDGPFIVVALASRHDRRYAKRAGLKDGLSVKIKDTDKKPLDADIEIYLQKKRIARLKDLPPGSVIGVFGLSGKLYEIVLMDVLDRTETITVGLRLPR